MRRKMSKIYNDRQLAKIKKLKQINQLFIQFI